MEVDIAAMLVEFTLGIVLGISFVIAIGVIVRTAIVGALLVGLAGYYTDIYIPFLHEKTPFEVDIPKEVANVGYISQFSEFGALFAPLLLGFLVGLFISASM